MRTARGTVDNTSSPVTHNATRATWYSTTGSVRVLSEGGGICATFTQVFLCCGAPPVLLRLFSRGLPVASAAFSLSVHTIEMDQALYPVADIQSLAKRSCPIGCSLSS